MRPGPKCVLHCKGVRALYLHIECSGVSSTLRCGVMRCVVVRCGISSRYVLYVRTICALCSSVDLKDLIHVR